MAWTHVVTRHGSIVYYGTEAECVEEAAIRNTRYETDEYRVEKVYNARH